MKLNVYVDGDKVGNVSVNINDELEIKKVLEKVFDCELNIEDFVCDFEGDEIYIGISECEYLWNK